MDMESRTDEELDAIRKAAAAEQARRVRVEEGREHIGQVVREHMEAAKLECPDLDDPELGEYVVGLIVEDQDDA